MTPSWVELRSRLLFDIGRQINSSQVCHRVPPNQPIHPPTQEPTVQGSKWPLQIEEEATKVVLKDTILGSKRV